MKESERRQCALGHIVFLPPPRARRLATFLSAGIAHRAALQPKKHGLQKVEFSTQHTDPPLALNVELIDLQISSESIFSQYRTSRVSKVVSYVVDRFYRFR